jgi:hypothetical protein
MAYDEALADRVRRVLGPDEAIEERKMFGGIAFMRGGKMFCGIVNDELMVRVGPDHYAESLKKPHVRPMDFTGTPMKGYVFVAPAGSKTDAAVRPWVELGDAFTATVPAKKKKARARPPSRPRKKARRER